jgi:hypothetical protein
MKSNRKIYILFILGICLVGSACEDFGTVSRPCVDNLDCPLDQECDLDTFVCVDKDLVKPLSVIDLELTPEKGSGNSATQSTVDLKEVDYDKITLNVVSAEVLVGQITSPDVMGGIPGTLVATRSPDFDNRKLTWNISVSESGDFETELSPGVYDLLFKPSNREGFPQLMLTGFEIPSEKAPDLSYHKFDDPEQDPPLVVTGQVLVSQTSPYPAPNIKVEGITDQGLRTSISEPDEQGYFELRLPFSRSVEPDGDFKDYFPETIDITIRPNNADQRLPTVTVTGVELAGTELGTFYIGDVPASVSFSGVVVDSRGRPLSECQLRFTADNIGNGTFSYQMDSDTTGNFSTSLPMGTYKVMAIPDLQSEAAIGSEIVELSADCNKNIILPDRAVLSGTVTDDAGMPVKDVIVEARRLSTVGGVDDGVVRTFEVISEADGYFEIPVDMGRYRITMIPSAESGLPRSLPTVAYVLDDYVMDSSATRLAPATVIQGHVFGQNGAMPLCGVTIDVFHSDEDNAYLIGQTISSSVQNECSGSFAVIIPGNLMAQ